MADPRQPEQIGEATIEPRSFRCTCGYSGDLYSFNGDRQEYEFKVIADRKTGEHLHHRLVPKKMIL